MISPEQRIAIGYISRTKGVRGDVKVEVLTHDARRFDEVGEVVVQKDGFADRPLHIEHWRLEQPGVRLKFVGIDSPEEAREVVVKGYITVAPDEVGDLPADTYYIFELENCLVVDELGNELGHIAEVLQMPSTDVYVVKDDQREILIPAVEYFIVDVDIAQQRLVVRGLEELLKI